MAEEHAFLQHQNIGDTFSGVYYVEAVFVKQTKQLKNYLDLTLRDRSGGRYVKYWGTLEGIEKGIFVFIAANVEDYQGSPSIIAKNIEKAEEPTDLSNYIPIYDDSDKQAERFDSIRDELKKAEAETDDQTAGMIVDEVYGNSRFFEKFVVSPGSIRPHYGRQGGLLANTVRVADACLNAEAFYQFTSQERVILLSSALLHRIGAIDAFEFQDCVPVETKKGMLLGIGNLTMTRVSSALKRVISALNKAKKSADQDTIIRLLHAVSAYDGICVKPMTKESLLLHSVWRTDGNMVDAIEFIQNDVNEGDEFTAYDPILRRRYFTG